MYCGTGKEQLRPAHRMSGSTTFKRGRAGPGGGGTHDGLGTDRRPKGVRGGERKLVMSKGSSGRALSEEDSSRE